MMTTIQQRAVDFTVNGNPVTREVEVMTTLAEMIRDDLGLTGTKVSCEMQVCGACTVLVDGHPVSACTYLAVDVDGCDVGTVEGLAGEDGVLSPIQQAFLDEFALQCGFCTPGFLMMASALLEENASPSADDVRRYLEGNICRCSGYRPIVSAVLAAAETSRRLGPERPDGSAAGVRHD